MELECEADTGTPGDTMIRYQWTRDGTTVMPEERQDGTLVIPSIREDESDNGLYRCSFVVRVNGVNAAPLLIPAATVVLTVGGKELYKSEMSQGE